jgi:hypothetical protein
VTRVDPPPWRTGVLAAVLAVGALLVPTTATAGPPYDTDDPEPVELHHWELYLATHHSLTRAGANGFAPHVEMNYGAVPGLQLHVLAPLAYYRPSGGPSSYGVGDIELGVKYRFVEAGRWWPMVGTFPFLEVPSGSAARGLGTGHPHAFVPLWLQKSAGPWTTYGGGGYWINPGAGLRNWWYAGWQAQRKLAHGFTPGAEVYYVTADHAGGRGDLRFNVGLVLDLGAHHHLLFSAGRSIVGDTRVQGYFAYQLTL